MMMVTQKLIFDQLCKIGFCLSIIVSGNNCLKILLNNFIKFNPDHWSSNLLMYSSKSKQGDNFRGRGRVQKECHDRLSNLFLKPADEVGNKLCRQSAGWVSERNSIMLMIYLHKTQWKCQWWRWSRSTSGGRKLIYGIKAVVIVVAVEVDIVPRFVWGGVGEVEVEGIVSLWYWLDQGP